MTKFCTGHVTSLGHGFLKKLTKHSRSENGHVVALGVTLNWSDPVTVFSHNNNIDWVEPIGTISNERCLDADWSIAN